MEHYHQGTCEATARGKRYGKNLTPQRFDDPGHNWKQAKAENWGAWDCCGLAADSNGCQMRKSPSFPRPTQVGARAAGPRPSSGVGAYIQFLINNKERVLVSDEDRNCWILSSGRVAKKATEGVSWVWEEEEGAVG